MSTTVEEIEKVETSESKKSELPLDSLEIMGYRCFEHLTVEKLGRVNLIVGKNNVGKTNFLESIWIYSKQGAIYSLFDVLQSRDEVQVTTDDYIYNDELLKNSINNIGNLFLGRPDIKSNLPSEAFIKSSKNKLEMNVGWYIERDEFLEKAKNFNSLNAKLYYVSYFEKLSRKKQQSENHPQAINLEEIRSIKDSFSYIPNTDDSSPTSYFIKFNGISNSQASRLWDSISLTDLEEEVVKALKIITPDVKKLGFLSPSNNNSRRIAMGRLSNQLEPIPLRAFGEGMNRLLGIALALVNCKNGILLIDETESGLHYSILPDVWKLIFKTARDLNVQVFATTHSYDCIEAFAQAAIDDEKSDGMLIRLARKDDQIKAFTFDEKQLETITKEHIEVR